MKGIMTVKYNSKLRNKSKRLTKKEKLLLDVLEYLKEYGNKTQDFAPMLGDCYCAACKTEFEIMKRIEEMINENI